MMSAWVLVAAFVLLAHQARACSKTVRFFEARSPSPFNGPATVPCTPQRFVIPLHSWDLHDGSKSNYGRDFLADDKSLFLVSYKADFNSYTYQSTQVTAIDQLTLVQKWVVVSPWLRAFSKNYAIRFPSIQVVLSRKAGLLFLISHILTYDYPREPDVKLTIQGISSQNG